MADDPNNSGSLVEILGEMKDVLAEDRKAKDEEMQSLLSRHIQVTADMRSIMVKLEAVASEGINGAT